LPRRAGARGHYWHCSHGQSGARHAFIEEEDRGNSLNHKQARGQAS